MNKVENPRIHRMCVTTTKDVKKYIERSAKRLKQTPSTRLHNLSLEAMETDPAERQ